MSGYRGFRSKAEYEAHYSDPRNHADEIKSMETYAKDTASGGQPAAETECPAASSAAVISALRDALWRAVVEMEMWCPVMARSEIEIAKAALAKAKAHRVSGA